MMTEGTAVDQWWRSTRYSVTTINATTAATIVIPIVAAPQYAFEPKAAPPPLIRWCDCWTVLDQNAPPRRYPVRARRPHRQVRGAATARRRRWRSRVIGKRRGPTP